MRIVIIGGGKVGGYLAGQLIAAGHAVTVIEADSVVADRIAETIDGIVINGDGTDIETLRSAKADRVDWLLAVTGKDEVNLVSCELGTTLGVANTLARLNDPRNRATFEGLGIKVVGVTGLIGEVIEHELDREFFDRLTLLGLGALSIIEIEVENGSQPRLVRDLDLPPETLLVAVVAPDGTATVPSGETLVRSGDRVVAVTAIDREPAVRDVISGVGH
jgi:trk system potassium uptake protein TrkA